jgi:hypothetical protein
MPDPLFFALAIRDAVLQTLRGTILWGRLSDGAALPDHAQDPENRQCGEQVLERVPADEPAGRENLAVIEFGSLGSRIQRDSDQDVGPAAETRREKKEGQQDGDDGKGLNSNIGPQVSRFWPPRPNASTAR